MSDRIRATFAQQLRLMQPQPIRSDSLVGEASDVTTWSMHLAPAETVADDDERRDAAVVQLLGGALPRLADLNTGGAEIPAVLVQFWDTRTDLPRDVSECIASWDRLADEVPGMTRVMFDDDQGRQFIRDELSHDHAAAFDACRHPMMRCDYFRLCFLLKYGGVYADDVFLGGRGPELLVGPELKLQPLCYNVATDEMVTAEVSGRSSPQDPRRAVAPGTVDGSRRAPLDPLREQQSACRSGRASSHPSFVGEGHTTTRARGRRTQSQPRWPVYDRTRKPNRCSRCARAPPRHRRGASERGLHRELGRTCGELLGT
jgi:hypothetical protein